MLISQNCTQAPAEQILSLIRTNYGPPKVSQLLRHLTSYNLIQLNRFEPICLVSPTKREELTVKLLQRYFPELNIQMIYSPAEPTQVQGPLEQFENAAKMLIQRGIEQEGIFRLTKSLTRPEELRIKIHSGDVVDWHQENLYDLATLFKCSLLKSLPEMLKEEDIRQIVATNDPSSYLSSLSPDRRRFLGLLGRVCRAIDGNKDRNRMDMSNLARVIAPNMFQHQDPLVEFRLINATIEATRIILSNA